jgi:hypothetical protein
MNRIFRSYSEFAPIVASIKAGDSSARFLGSGAESSVWHSTVNGTEYVIKLINTLSARGKPRDTLRATEGKINAGIRGLGIRGLEQLQAASLDDRATVHEYAQGIPVSSMTEADAEMISDKHIADLYETILSATEAGIEFDGWNSEGDNAFFSPDSGFTLIDYWATERKIRLSS